MAVIVKKQPARSHEPGIIKTYIHRCGTLIQVETTARSLIGFLSMEGGKINVCPTCKKSLTWEDTQIPDNVAAFGWPDD